MIEVQEKRKKYKESTHIDRLYSSSLSKGSKNLWFINSLGFFLCFESSDLAACWRLFLSVVSLKQNQNWQSFLHILKITFSNFKILNSNTTVLWFKGISNFAKGQKAGFNNIMFKKTKILYLLTEINNFTSKLYSIWLAYIDRCWYMQCLSILKYISCYVYV